MSMSVAATLQAEILRQKQARDKGHSRSRSRDRSVEKFRERIYGRSRSRSHSRERAGRSRSRSRDRFRSRSRSPVRRKDGDGYKHISQTKNTNSSDPALLNARVFIGSLPTDKATRTDLENLFRKYGRVLAVSLLNGYGFVQYEKEKDARLACKEESGTLLYGSKLEVKMAAEGRKSNNRFPDRRSSPPRRSPPRRSPPRRSPPRRRSPPPRRARSRSLDRDRDRVRERDSIRDRRDDLYGRSLSLSYRDSYDRLDPYGRDPYPPPLPPPRPLPPITAIDPVPFRPPFECEIIMNNSQLRTYAETIERLLKPTGMLIQQNVVKSDTDVPKAVEDLTRLKVPYAVIIADQNEMHRSITLNILHGTTQEHRNMPLDDAMKLVATNFEAYVREIREKAAAPAPLPASRAPRRDLPEFVPPDEHTSYLLHLLGDNRILTLEELDHAIGYLDKRRRILIEARGGAGTRPPPPARAVDLHDPGLGRSLPPAYTPSPAPPTSASASINFSNPSVQKALDDLMQTSPSVLGGRPPGPGYHNDYNGPSSRPLIPY